MSEGGGGRGRIRVGGVMGWGMLKDEIPGRFYRCLQEISYLTSPGALNPLPSRIPLSISGPSSVDGVEGGSANGGEPVNSSALGSLAIRPKKVLSEEPIPSIFEKEKEKEMEKERKKKRTKRMR